MAELVSEGTRCPACGETNRAGRKFCAECGASLAVRCPSCGSANEPGERFCGECGGALEPGAVSVAETVAPAQGVERRLVSVLFADLVGHTALSEQRDVEEVRDLLSRYADVARTIVERYGGEIEKFIGDAVMAVWGTPTAREDDAERAVRAALDLAPAVAALGAELGAPTLAARAAVLTGEAAVTLGAQGQGMVAGDLVNTASRVQGLAEPGAVLVGEATRRASEAAIAYEDAGAHELKGKAEPLPLWRAVRVTAGRGGSLKSDTLEPPFVGREREVRLLKELFHASADESKAHLVSIVGIAGIGKSRLAWELQKYFDGVAQVVQWHRGRCLAYGEGVSYWALAEMVRMRAGIAEGEEPESARAKLRSALESYVEDPDERDWIEPRMARLLALEAAGEGDPTDLFAGWRLFLERLAERDPVVLVFEDMQWADAPLLEFVEYLLDWSRSHPLFVLALARPELGERHPSWGSSRNSTTFSLEPLAEDAMRELLEGLVPGLPDEIARQVLDRAEGIPLYAVETVRMLLDRGLLEQQGGRYEVTGPIEALEVPETLHALVAARIDGLTDEERQLVQDASVVGKTFPRSALAAVASTPEAEVERVLTALVRKEILSLQADPRSPERGQYGFLQDLLRQVAYETMPRGERKARHLAVAAQLESEWAESEPETAEIVAFHYLTALELDSTAADAAEIGKRARVTLVRAGERAASLAGTESAQRYFEQALELADTPLERAELRERAGEAAMLCGRTVAARTHFEQAIATFEEIGLTHPAARVTARLGILTWHQEGDIERAISDLERALSVLANEERDADVAMLTVQLGRTLFFTGQLDDALARTEQALEIAEALRLPEVFSHGLNTKSLILSARGRHEEGELLMRHSLETALAHDLSDAALRGYVNLTATVFGWDRYGEALDLSRQGAQLARKVGDRFQILDGWIRGILVTLGEWDEALATVDPTGEDIWSRYLRAQVSLRRGEREEVARLLPAIEADTDMNEPQGRAQLRQLQANVFLAEGRASEALAAAEAALADRAALLNVLVSGSLVAALEAAFSLRDEAKIDELMAIVEELPPGELTPFLRAVGARFSGRRAALRGDPETASTAFLAAARILEEIETPFELAVVSLEHAEWLASEARGDEAQPLLDEARQIFERLRATPWLERVESVELAPAEPAAVD